MGYNRFISKENNFELVLIFGDIADVIKSFHARINVWYLDGFSPNKNPDMWSEEIFSFIKSNSKIGARFATYSTSGIVKKGLSKAGFILEKVEGFGKKKEMLKGNLPVTNQKIKDKPWFKIPKINLNKRKALIIGGGLAGTSVAYALSKKGFDISIVEKEEKFAPGASGNIAGMFAPILTAENSELSNWNNQAYKEFTQFLNQNSKYLSEIFFNTGVFEIINSNEQMVKLEKAILNSKLSNQDVVTIREDNSFFNHKNGFFFPNAGWINPVALSNFYLSLAGDKVNRILSTKVNRIKYENNLWKVFLSNNEILESEIVILANSFDTVELADGFEKIRKVRGQILYYPSNQFPIPLDKVVLHEDGYIIPNVNGMHVVGSTFNPNDLTNSLNLEHNQYLLQNLKKIVPDIRPELGTEMDGRVAFRAMSSDHLPLVGPVPDVNIFRKSYEDLWKSNPYKDYIDGEYVSGLYVSTAHGARGILNSYFAAMVLSSMILNESIPIENELLEKVNPSRFLIQSYTKR